jgi:hypothetical protein
MTVEFAAAGSLGLSYSERLTACHEGAQQALNLASDAPNPEQRAMHLEVVRRWDELAHQIERAMEAQYNCSVPPSPIR